MPRYVRVKIVTPEMEAAERRAGIILGLTLAAVVVQLLGALFLALGIAGSRISLIVIGGVAIPLGSWGVQFVDGRARCRPLRTGRLVLSVGIATLIAVLVGMNVPSV
ncbi:hypothetical protein OHT76_21375 [Streptomyces sp. NBC_00287]|uniref:hypothetical protein n=1 Tax=Streptomyces sp. NBC_00287 TaxID=2975702 RepID=UPI002E27CF8A|nr:hypothetical protein [Streptomyces sp. NBC_00287]